MHSVDTPSRHVFVLAAIGSRQAVFDTVLVVDCLRHSRGIGTMILDGYVVLIAEDQVGNFYKLMNWSIEAIVYQLEEEETEIWKNIPAAAVESCRQGWYRKLTCENLKTGRIPLSVEPWTSLICSCGQGEGNASFPRDSFISPLRKSATRIAIPYLSAVSSLEARDPATSVRSDSIGRLQPWLFSVSWGDDRMPLGCSWCAQVVKQETENINKQMEALTEQSTRISRSRPIGIYETEERYS